MNQIELLKEEIKTLKQRYLKKSDSPIEKTNQVTKITEELKIYLNELDANEIDEETQIEIDKVVDFEVSNLMNSIYS